MLSTPLEDRPTPTLLTLQPLVGSWQITGDATGQVTYRWLPGQGFLVQEGHLEYAGRRNEFVELIGRRAGDADITSRVYTGAGETLDYTHELTGRHLVIWFGARGSDNRFEGEIDPDGGRIAGAWSWPGGGYATVASRTS